MRDQPVSRPVLTQDNIAQKDRTSIHALSAILTHDTNVRVIFTRASVHAVAVTGVSSVNVTQVCVCVFLSCFSKYSLHP
jgi:hypothetical protein